MTDLGFQQLLDRLSNAHERYANLRDQAEEEYERRFGRNPSDWDDDFWIDTFHVSPGSATVAQVTKHAEFCKTIQRPRTP